MMPTPTQSACTPPAVHGALRRHPRLAVAAGLFTLLLLAGLGALWWLHPAATPPAAANDDSGDFHWQEAQRALEARDFDTAGKHLDRCLEAWPFNAEAHFLMARTRRRDGDFAAWGSHLEAAQFLGWPADQIELEARLWQAQVGDVWAVERPLQAYLQSGPAEEVLILEALVRGYLDDERLRDALTLTEIWKGRYPDDWLAWLYHGRALHLGGEATQAVADYCRALELRPEHPEALAWRAAAYMTDKRFAEARADYQAFLRQHPDDAEARYRVAQCEWSLNDPDAARAALDRLLTVHHDHGPGLFLRAQLDLTDGNPAKALRWLERAEPVAPRDPDVLHTLARTLRQLHRDAEAKTYERRFQEISRRQSELRDLVEQIHKHPARVSLRYAAGVADMELGRELEAAHWFRSVLSLEPGHRKTHQLMADYYQKEGDTRRADYHRRWLTGKARPAAIPVP